MNRNVTARRMTTRLVPLVLAVGLVVTAQPARAQQGATAPTQGELRRLTRAQLLGAQYHLPLLGDGETPIRFHGGRGSIEYGTGATERVQAAVAGDLIALGDLDGDNVADAAVVVSIDSGGSGTFIHLLAMQDRDNAPVQAGRVFLGDRVRVQSLTISGRRIFVTMLAHGPGDGLCCPSVEIGRAFTLRGRRLLPSRPNASPVGRRGAARLGQLHRRPDGGRRAVGNFVIP